MTNSSTLKNYLSELKSFSRCIKVHKCALSLDYSITETFLHVKIKQPKALKNCSNSPQYTYYHGLQIISFYLNHSSCVDHHSSVTLHESPKKTKTIKETAKT